MRRVFVAAALVAGALVLGCGSEPEPPNVLLITVDSLRWDRLGHAGLDREVSPAIDGLASSGVVFERAYSQAGWTLPSIATLLTGVYPGQHGAVQADRAVSSSVVSLAERLREHGYRTLAHVSHVMLRPRTGVARGFDEYDDSVLQVGRPHRVATAEVLTDKVLASLETVTEPFFLWVHYFDPHFAYLSHEDWASFGDEDLDRYDGEVAHTDRQIGRLLRKMAELGLDDRTAVVLTSDHGEEFGEHGGRLHFSLHEEVSRVPLILRVPGVAPSRRTDPAEQIDLVPTLLSLVGAALPEGLPGRDLLAGEGSSGPIFMERHRPAYLLQRAVIRDRYKLYAVSAVSESPEPGARRPGIGVGPGLFLYDLETDPGETTNLWRTGHPVAPELLELLRRDFPVAAEPSAEAPIGEELGRQLESLGYID